MSIFHTLCKILLTNITCTKYFRLCLLLCAHVLKLMDSKLYLSYTHRKKILIFKTVSPLAIFHWMVVSVIVLYINFRYFTNAEPQTANIIPTLFLATRDYTMPKSLTKRKPRDKQTSTMPKLLKKSISLTYHHFQLHNLWYFGSDKLARDAGVPFMLVS